MYYFCFMFAFSALSEKLFKCSDFFFHAEASPPETTVKMKTVTPLKLQMTYNTYDIDLYRNDK